MLLNIIKKTTNKLFITYKKNNFMINLMILNFLKVFRLLKLTITKFYII